MVNEDGLVKVLDFGLAKLTDPTPASEDEFTRTMRRIFQISSRPLRGAEGQSAPAKSTGGWPS